MDFIRKRKRGTNSKVERYWFSECGQYRITWRTEVFGVKVTPRYHACVRVVERDGYEWWNFAGRRSPYRKFKAAVEAAEKHRRVWEYALKLAAGERKGRADRLRALEAKSRVGTGVSRHRILASMPRWVLGDPALRNLTTVLFPDGKQRADECNSPPDGSEPSPSVRTSLSASSEIESSSEALHSSGNTPTNGHASNVRDPAASTTPTTHHVASREIRCETASSARPAKAVGACPSKPSKAAYDEKIRKYKEEKAEYDNLVEAREAALKKLTKEECQALKALGL